jgi:hypothetical protein
VLYRLGAVEEATRDAVLDLDVRHDRPFGWRRIKFPESVDLSPGNVRVRSAGA